MKSVPIGFILCVNITPQEILFLDLHNVLCMETYQIPRKSKDILKLPLNHKSFSLEIVQKYFHLLKVSTFTLYLEGNHFWKKKIYGSNFFFMIMISFFKYIEDTAYVWMPLKTHFRY